MIKSILSAYMTMGLSIMNDIQSKSEEKKAEILLEWEKSKNYPRKKKKRIRKELNLDWVIASWNPFEI